MGSDDVNKYFYGSFKRLRSLPRLLNLRLSLFLVRPLLWPLRNRRPFRIQSSALDVFARRSKRAILDPQHALSNEVDACDAHERKLYSKTDMKGTKCLLWAKQKRTTQKSERKIQNLTASLQTDSPADPSRTSFLLYTSSNERTLSKLPGIPFVWAFVCFFLSLTIFLESKVILVKERKDEQVESRRSRTLFVVGSLNGRRNSREVRSSVRTMKFRRRWRGIAWGRKRGRGREGNERSTLLRVLRKVLRRNERRVNS